MRRKEGQPALPKAVAVVGPTASGKTSLAIALARRFGGEIVSADSRQLYRGMRIGAAVPEGRWTSKEGRRSYLVEGVPHHLMDVRSPARPVTAAEFRAMAARKLRDIARRGKVPFLVGGTGLYVSAVVDGLAIPEVPPDPAVRGKLERLPTGRLYGMLARRDPAYAARIPKENRRYVIRALEVMQATGTPFSELQRRRTPAEFEWLRLGIMRPREELYRRIDRRVDEMMGEGLRDEAARLGRRYGWERPSMTGIGHRQFRAYLEGEEPLEKAVVRLKRDTRRYAKRQLTWFRRDRKIVWVKGEAEAVRRVQKFLKN